ncbi:MAG: site-specific DNA-methyltransferase [Alphaproteobacteria bacterium]|nr:site-specific DNA-methyltransferase [Alphaproteobacteria bacterium]
MPILNWLGRDDALKTATNTPYRLLEEVPELGYGDKTKENMIIQGDNLEALKALLPFYAGQVKCIYIDPPYNTGSAFEHYDDNLEHSTWLSLMYSRLELLKEFLREDGSIWISIDADESHYLKVLCDEIFGRQCFVDEVIWQRAFAPVNLKKTLSRSHDAILVYCKNPVNFVLNTLPRSDKQCENYKNPDDDSRGPWTSADCTVGPVVEEKLYEIITPSGRSVFPPEGRCWLFTKDRFNEMVADGRIWFGKDGNNAPRVKKFISEVKGGVVATTLWTRDECGDNQEAKREIKALFPNEKNPFDTPKPERLIQRVITLATDEGDLVLDSFLGSGTTAAVAHKMGRRYIGIEMGNHAITYCVPRLKAVIDGEQGGISKSVNWQGGGGFRFYKLGEQVFDADGCINENISFENLSAHIWFTETKTPFNKPAEKTTYLGTFDNISYALLYNGILKDKRVDGGNVLTNKTLNVILDDMKHQPYEKLVIYGESSRISPARLKTLHIEFKQTPYDIKAR